MNFSPRFSTVPLTAAALAASSLLQAQEAPPTDARISAAIENEVSRDTSIPAALLWVSTDDGIVKMTGICDNILARERAAAIARTVRGVRAVVNDIRVVPHSAITPVALQQDVDAALRADPVTEAFEIEAEAVDGGRVVLTGKTQSWAERAVAENVVKGVEGVAEVINQIVVDWPVARTDEEIREDVVARLRWDVLVDAGLIDVTCEDGVVELRGAVGSAAERWRAIKDAEVQGAVDLKAEDLEVKAWADDDMQRMSKHVVRSPEQIEAALRAAFRHDPRVAPFAIEIEIDGDRVTLRGEVGTLKASRAAAQDARNTLGVVDVVNRLRVVPGKLRPAEEIVADVRAALARDPFVDGDDVTVQSIHGVVRLTGRVDSNLDRARIDDLAGGVTGVVDVDNRLAVRDDRLVPFDPYVDAFAVHHFRWYGPQLMHVVKTDDEIARQIEHEFWWSPFVTSTRIHATVENGVATLRGRAASVVEKQAAIENAFDAGAVWVFDRIVLEDASDAGEGDE
ncbi:MAG: BON domain-containing protein [Planctomycetes bacterium]|nr:BON domain-containing protein [Planctomycetota bacterium]